MKILLEDIKQNIHSYYHYFVALLPKLALALLVVIALLFISNFIQGYSQRRLTKRMDDPLLARFIARLIGTAVIIFALLVALNIVGLGNMAVGLLSTAGLGAFVLGFAFKDIGENFLAGVVLAFSRPFRVGDIVELNGHKGRVVTLNLRDTQMKTLDGRDIFIPNANVIKNAVVSYTFDGFLREEITIGLNYSTNRDQAIGIIQSVLDKYPGILHEEGKSPDIVYEDLAAKTLHINVRYWIDIFIAKLPAHEIKQQIVMQIMDGLTAAGFKLQDDVVEIKTLKE